MREKLIDALESIGIFDVTAHSESIADHLIANGVTVREKGEWVQCFEDWRCQIEGDKCSACGFEHYGCSINHFHFCPNCGADMRGEENGSRK